MASRSTHTACFNEDLYTYYKEGAYGVIFVNKEKNKIIKIFYTNVDKDIKHQRNVFYSENLAYEIAMAVPSLRAVIPQYYGPCEPIMVRNADGVDVSSNYHTEYAFTAEFIKGFFQKIGSVLPNKDISEDWERLKKIFYKAKIEHLTDVSVLIQGDKIVSVVDFATQEYVLQHRI